ncbi:response regulator [Flavobacterium sp. 3HN19-14]|uniref:response regulator n=1 Tax=Flavobacterium sp. 3HN19-14 TaxID=3448133 RepID=UPI003EE3F1BD
MALRQKIDLWTGKKVLIIDDDTRNIFALSAVLRARSYEILSCTSAKEALEILKGDTIIDAVLIDMMMPDIDGYEAIPLIKKMPERKDVPVISVTAQAMVGDREKCLAAGADGYISKPVDVDKLLHLLTTL